MLHPDKNRVLPVMCPAQAPYAAQLLDQAHRALRARIGDPRTEAIYGMWIRRFLEFAAPRRREDLDELLAEAFLARLALVENVSPMATKRARRALAFLEIVVLHRPSTLPAAGALAS